MNGYAGKILRIDLSSGGTSEIETAKYEQWGGGHGMGSAIFYDIVVEEKGVDLSAVDGFSPENVITVMTSPLCGTMVPGASGRTEMQGIGLQSYPIGWFTRSNFGGRFAAMLKFAGWDGIVVEGASDEPVWVDIRDDVVQIKKCASLELWGKYTWECQTTIWDHVAQGEEYGDWMAPSGEEELGRTTQRPAVLAIGPAGEAGSSLACLIHDAGNASGQGGFGGVWGAKKLKAISVIGTGAIDVADPKALIAARLREQRDYAFDPKATKPDTGPPRFYSSPVPQELGGMAAAMKGGDISRKERKRPQACVGCHSGCRGRYENAVGNEASCQATAFYVSVAPATSPGIQYKATDVVNKYGINSYELQQGLGYIHKLYEQGLLGKGKQIECDLDFSTWGKLEFVEQVAQKISSGPDEFSGAIRQGFVRAAKKWGRLEQDLASGELRFPYWGLPEHNYDPRAELEWGYGTILGDRDINEHCFNSLFWQAFIAMSGFKSPKTGAAEAVDICTSKMVPYDKDEDRMLMLDFANENMYSSHMAKLVAWHRHYTRFWKQSALYCDYRWPDFVNLRRPDKRGATPKAESEFFNAVTGKDMTFADGMEIGRKIWNLDHAIWTLQGRSREMVRFAAYIFDKPYGGFVKGFPLYPMPGRQEGTWNYLNMAGRSLDNEGFERFKDEFYKLEGWNLANGYPTRATLESLGLAKVAERLEIAGKLG